MLVNVISLPSQQTTVNILESLEIQGTLSQCVGDNGLSIRVEGEEEGVFQNAEFMVVVDQSIHNCI